MELDYVAIRALFPETPAPDFQYSTAHKYIHLLADECEALKKERDTLKDVLARANVEFQRLRTMIEADMRPAVTEDSIQKQLSALLARLVSLNNKLEAEDKIVAATRREVIDFLTESGHPDAAEAIAIRYREDSADE